MLFLSGKTEVKKFFAFAKNNDSVAGSVFYISGDAVFKFRYK